MGSTEQIVGSMLVGGIDGCCGGRILMERCGADLCPGRGGDAAARHPASNKASRELAGGDPEPDARRGGTEGGIGTRAQTVDMATAIGMDVAYTG